MKELETYKFLKGMLMFSDSLRKRYCLPQDTALEKHLNVACQALKKQIPKKPTYEDFDDNGAGEIIPYKAICPVCENEFEFGTWNDIDNHHCICGQRMDWGE